MPPSRTTRAGHREAPLRRPSEGRGADIPGTAGADPLHALYSRPGFLIRRAHQIAVSLFIEEMGALGVTPTQSGILFVLSHRGGLDQISVARLLGLDRSTASMVIAKLVKAGLVARGIGAGDRRRRALVLTPKGRRLIDRLEGPLERARTRVLSPFTAEEAAQFVALLDKFTAAFNGTTRVPMIDERLNGEGEEDDVSDPR
jgi:DNA-binding MarR family transcriptional regulator